MMHLLEPIFINLHKLLFTLEISEFRKCGTEFCKTTLNFIYAFIIGEETIGLENKEDIMVLQIFQGFYFMGD